MVIDSIFSKISTLSERDKIRLVEMILNSLNPLDKEIENAWEEEIEKRIEAYEKSLLK